MRVIDALFKLRHSPLDVPLVLFNRSPREHAVHAVLCDQGEAARLLVSRLAEAGLRRVMVDAATLVHLERQSQGRADEQAGRWNLTLLNAWTYNHRWRRG